MSAHKTPKKVTVEFADGTSVVYSDTVSTAKTVVVLDTRLADQDQGSSSTWDKSYTAILYKQ